MTIMTAHELLLFGKSNENEFRNGRQPVIFVDASDFRNSNRPSIASGRLPGELSRASRVCHTAAPESGIQQSPIAAAAVPIRQRLSVFNDSRLFSELRIIAGHNSESTRNSFRFHGIEIHHSGTPAMEPHFPTECRGTR